MQTSNQQTLESYESHVQEYIDGTPQTVPGVVKEWLDEAIARLPKDARILELGSAFGRDASYLQNIGFTVECTDATQAFVDLLRQKGFNARKLNAIIDDLGGPYDFVLANAVLLHFTRDETKHVLQKIYSALKNSGIFAFTLKQGTGETWTKDKLGAPRYFCFWAEDQIRKVLEDVGFSQTKITADQATANSKWLQIIAKK